MKEWFPHDYHAVSDPKIRSLIRRCGAAGYGLYWYLVETLHVEHSMSYDVAIDALCFGMGCDERQVTAFLDVATSSGLIKLSDGVITIERVFRNLQYRQDATERGAKAAAKRWAKLDAKRVDAMPTQCTCNADAMQTQCTCNAITRHNITEQDKTRKKKKEDTTLLARTSDEVPAGSFAIVTNKGDLFVVTSDQVTRWRDLFPAVDVPQALRSIAAWSEANRAKRKTASGMMRFVTSWLTREQNRGNQHGQQQPKRTAGDRVVGDGSALGYVEEIISERDSSYQLPMAAPMARQRLVAAEVRPQD